MGCIAVADDDADLRTAAVIGLRRAGHTVLACEDGGALVDRVRAAAPDVIVTDNQMPVLTGLEVVAILREDPATAGIPVILASGSIPPGEGRDVLGDSDQVLPKPYTARQLREAVDAALRFGVATA